MSKNQTAAGRGRESWLTTKGRYPHLAQPNSPSRTPCVYSFFLRGHGIWAPPGSALSGGRTAGATLSCTPPLHRPKDKSAWHPAGLVHLKALCVPNLRGCDRKPRQKHWRLRQPGGHRSSECGQAPFLAREPETAPPPRSPLSRPLRACQSASGLWNSSTLHPSPSQKRT